MPRNILTTARLRGLKMKGDQNLVQITRMPLTSNGIRGTSVGEKLAVKL